MAENDNITPKVETKTGTETTPPVQAPVSTATPKDVTPPDLGVITSDNSGKTDTREDPSKMVETGVESSKAEENTTPTSSPKASSLSLEELQEKQRMGLLSLEEQQALEQKQNHQPNDASVKKLPNQEEDSNDPEKGKFSEGDVIDYMYKEWLIAGALYLDQKIRKYGYYGYTKLRAAVNEHNAEKQARIKKIKSGKTYKNMEKIEELRSKKEKEIIEKTGKTEKDINDISAAINDGTLFDDKNKELLKKYEKMIGADTEEGKKKLKATREACEKRKADPNDKDAAKETRGIAARFAQDAKVNAEFDFKIEMAALNLTAANMTSQLTQNADKYPNIEKSFNQTLGENVGKLGQITQKDREHALETAEQKTRIQAAAMHAGGANATAIIGATQRQWERNFAVLDKINSLSHEALEFSQKRILQGQTAEFGKEPEKNNKLEQANDLIKARQQVTNSSPKTQAQEVDTPPVAPAEPEKTLKEEGIVQAQADEEIAKKQKQVETDPRTAENARREQAHEDRGKKINPRIEEIKARALASRQAKQSGAEFMVDTMLANGNLTEDQQKALLDAGIAAEKNGKDGSTDEILKNMRESGQFSQDQIKTAREVNFAYGLAQKTGRE